MSVIEHRAKDACRPPHCVPDAEFPPLRGERLVIGQHFMTISECMDSSQFYYRATAARRFGCHEMGSIRYSNVVEQASTILERSPRLFELQSMLVSFKAGVAIMRFSAIWQNDDRRIRRL
jgi:hypothetical protein